VPIPRVESQVARPRSPADEIRITWVGHATTLIQMGAVNVLTDPVWSRRVSPVRWAGPARLTPPGLPFDALPPVSAVLLSHDHYDHLDELTVRALARSHPDARWYAPLGHGRWLERRGVRRVTEMDWWDVVTVAPRLAVRALPTQHWTRRSPGGMNRRLWCAFSLEDPVGRKVYFGGDSGYCTVFREIGQELGPFDAALIPIGAYEPRWFMKPAHMNPEEAVRVYLDLGGQGTFMGVHWGTFRLTDEPVTEPPERAKAAWLAADLPVDDLWIPAIGESRVVPRLTG